MNYTPDRSRKASTGPETSKKRGRGLALVAIAGVAVTLVLPYVRARHRGAHAMPLARGVLGGSGDPQAHAAEATAAIASLSSALGALGRVEARVHAHEVGGDEEEPEPPADPPDPANFDSPTACVRSYLPDVDLADDSMDPLCSERDAWTIERTLDVRLAHRRGGAKHWTRLGVYSLAALAAMRSGCCVAPEPLMAVVPGLWCGVLRDQLRALGPAPSRAAVAEYESMMACLAGRGVHLPERWSHTPRELSRSTFDEFREGARRRKRE